MKRKYAIGLILLPTALILANGFHRTKEIQPLGTMPAVFYNKGNAYVDHSFGDATWKKQMSQGKVPYHLLVASDFRFDDAVQSDSKVYTKGFIECEYKYQFLRLSSSQWKVILSDMKVTSGLDRTGTWRRSSMTDPSLFLPHEQGHLDINELAAKTFAGLLFQAKPEGIGDSQAEAVCDLERKILAIGEKVKEQNIKEQDAYDQATLSGWNQVAQTNATSDLTTKMNTASISRSWQVDSGKSNTSKIEVFL